MRIRIPADGWRPRPYQLPAWTYLERGGRHAELIWHRRSGKDDIALRHTCNAALKRPANYWHMLPKANQARRAIWEARNPHTGKRRIDEAFPHAIRRRTLEHEMFIEFVNNSTWQVLGSDNFQASIGSTPAGIVYSEWAQADPEARGYLRPILLENNGWQLFITTPRGKNHAYRTYQAALADPDAFAQVLTVEDTGIFTAEQLERERQAYVAEYGEDFGNALFEQEYLCSFSAAIHGSYYGAELARMERRGQIGLFPHNPEHPVYTAWDLGHTDDTAIWWFQIIAGRVRIIDYYAAHGHAVAHYAGQLIGREVELTVGTHRITAEYGADIPEAAHRKEYRYEHHYLPHDARQRRIESVGKSMADQLAAVVTYTAIRILPQESVELGIQAVRAMLPLTDFHAPRCEDGIEAIRQYRREWDEDKQAFGKNPVHDWTSHPADALRYLAMAWRYRTQPPEEQRKVIKPFTERWLEYDEYAERPKVRYR